MATARFLTRAFAGSALAVGATLALAAPASAHPEITNLNCTAGARVVLCDVTHVGTASPFTIRWWVNGFAVPSANDDVSMRSSCSPKKVVSVRVTITDPNGSATTSQSYFCGTFQP
jgi:hypothetical protein